MWKKQNILIISVSTDLFPVSSVFALHSKAYWLKNGSIRKNLATLQHAIDSHRPKTNDLESLRAHPMSTHLAGSTICSTNPFDPIFYFIDFCRKKLFFIWFFLCFCSLIHDELNIFLLKNRFWWTYCMFECFQWFGHYGNENEKTKVFFIRMKWRLLICTQIHAFTPTNRYGWTVEQLEHGQQGEIKRNALRNEILCDSKHRALAQTMLFKPNLLKAHWTNI